MSWCTRTRFKKQCKHLTFKKHEFVAVPAPDGVPAPCWHLSYRVAYCFLVRVSTLLHVCSARLFLRVLGLHAQLPYAYCGF